MTREEALKKMQEVKAYMTAGNPIWSVTVIGEAFDMAIEALEAEKRKTGEWAEATDVGDCCYRCSECGFIRDAYFLEAANFCPNCGARMERSE